MKRASNPLVALAGIGTLLVACSDPSGSSAPTTPPTVVPSDTTTRSEGGDTATSAGNGHGNDTTATRYAKPDNGVPWNDTVTSYGLLTDARDGQVYRTVRIGDQTWMAENLAFKSGGADSGWCPEGIADSCALYGRLYAWDAAMSDAAPTPSVPSGVQGICPEGWHLPSQPEWSLLVSTVQSDARVGPNAASRALRTSIHWTGVATSSTVGWDLFGFRALPAGMRIADGSFSGRGTMGSFWTTTESGGTKAVSADLLGPSALVHMGDGSKSGDAFSVRCVKN